MREFSYFLLLATVLTTVFALFVNFGAHDSRPYFDWSWRLAVLWLLADIAARLTESPRQPTTPERP